MAAEPLVSVVVPTRDRPELLRRAVTAILGQTYRGPIECVVVFDQSDPDLPWPELPPGRRLVLVRNQRTSGLAGADTVAASGPADPAGKIGRPPRCAPGCCRTPAAGDAAGWSPP